MIPSGWRAGPKHSMIRVASGERRKQQGIGKDKEREKEKKGKKKKQTKKNSGATRNEGGRRNRNVRSGVEWLRCNLRRLHADTLRLLQDKMVRQSAASPAFWDISHYSVGSGPSG